MTDALWAAVDAVTKSTSMRVFRDEGEADERSVIADYASRKVGICDVNAYRASVRGHGKIPSLWQQAEQALYKTGETLDGNRSPLATRSPADVQLMETMLTLRELVAEFFKDEDKPVPSSRALPSELRHMASEILRRGVDADLWAYRIEQLRRLLENHLQAVDRGPRQFRPRVRCPREDCLTEFISIPDPNGGDQKIVVRPLIVTYRDNLFRCFECENCGYTWFGESGKEQLRQEIKADEESRAAQAELSDESETMTA